MYLKARVAIIANTTVSNKVNKRQSEGAWPFIYLDVLETGSQSDKLLIRSKVPNSCVE